MVAVTPPKVWAKGDEGLTAVVGARLSPKTETTDPGATAGWGVGPAPLTMPVGRM